MKRYRVVGFDLGLNHGAAVELTSGKLSRFRYYTDSAGAACRSEDGDRIDFSKTGDKFADGVARLAWIADWIDQKILGEWNPTHAGIESYAIRASQGAHFIGELGGIARLLLWDRGVKFRLHDPVSVKMFATKDGTATKDLVEQCVREEFGADFSFCNPKSKSKKQNRRTSEDLADAFTVAQLVWTEIKLRSGEISASDLGHPKRIQVFNRVTKTYPQNILDREWICGASCQ